MTEEFLHVSVLTNELLEMMDVQKNDIAVDCTLGGGGHTGHLLKRAAKVIAFDRDEVAVAFVKKKFAKDIASEKLQIVQAPFSKLAENISGKVQKIIADIGVSSPQIDDANRGFSFAKDGPLDMRMDRSSGRSAADIVNEDSLDEIRGILRNLGEEPKAHEIAKAILRERAKKRIETTLELSELVRKAAHYKTESKKHPATRTFQALRIAVNDELGELQSMLAQAFTLLDVGGRLGVITFHSLEDRIVKDFMNDLSEKGVTKKLPRGIPLTTTEIAIGIHGKVLKPFPASASDDEIAKNPRARSAKLRVLEKLS